MDLQSFITLPKVLNFDTSNSMSEAGSAQCLSPSKPQQKLRGENQNGRAGGEMPFLCYYSSYTHNVVK